MNNNTIYNPLFSDERRTKLFMDEMLQAIEDGNKRSDFVNKTITR